MPPRQNKTGAGQNPQNNDLLSKRPYSDTLSSSSTSSINSGTSSFTHINALHHSNSSQSINQPLPPPTSAMKPNSAKIENIKNYYYQLSASLRNVTAQLTQPDLTPGRREALTLQQEKIQSSLNEFTEKVLKPLMSAARTGTPPAHVDGIGQSHTAHPASTYQKPPIPYSRQLQLASQHFQEAQQQQAAFQQRLQARASASSAHQQGASQASRPQSPSLRQSSPQSAIFDSLMHTEIDSLDGGDDGDFKLLKKEIVQSRKTLKEVFADDISEEHEVRILHAVDEMMDRIARASIDNARHSGSFVIADRDIAMAVEEVLGEAYRLPRWSFTSPVMPIIKRPTLVNTTHNARLAQIRKDQAALSMIKPQ